MSATSIIVQGVKSRLRAQGMSYRDLALLVGVSEPTVKRDLSRGRFSLQRFDKICEVLGVEITDLLQPAEDAQLTELSEHVRTCVCRSRRSRCTARFGCETLRRQRLPA